MSEALTLARPYARAAFALARDADALDEWAQSLTQAAQIASDPDVRALLNHPHVSKAQLVALHLPENQGEDGLFAHFLAELAHFDRLQLLPQIKEHFDALKRQLKATLKVNVISASAFTDSQRSTLEKALRDRYQQQIEMQVAVDPELLGGVIINAGGNVLDASIRGRLQRMAGTLTQ